MRSFREQRALEWIDLYAETGVHAMATIVKTRQGHWRVQVHR